jgi:predicted Zn finger-like uncharacterized protein
MIIQCPACATRYEVPDTAIGSEGRKVRCAKCRHNWYAVAIDDDADADTQPGEPEALPPAHSEPAVELAPAASDDMDAVSGAEPSPQVEADPVAEPAPVRARRRGLWAWSAIILAIMLAAAALAVTFWGMPEWVSGRTPTFATTAPDELVLDFPREQQGWRQLANGTEIFGASGTITNSGDTTRPVPPILIVLRDSRERIVYSWEVAPPRRSLAPGGSVAVNEAVTDAPRSAHFADIGWKPG